MVGLAVVDERGAGSVRVKVLLLCDRGGGELVPPHLLLQKGNSFNHFCVQD